MRLLDSDTLSHLWADHPNVVERLAACDEMEIGITSITKCEIMRARCENLLKAAGTPELLTAQRRLDRSERSLSELIIIPFDEVAGDALRRLEGIKRLRKIGRADLLIASIAIANDATLVTRNLRHFQRVPGLQVENWVD